MERRASDVSRRWNAALPAKASRTGDYCGYDDGLRPLVRGRSFAVRDLASAIRLAVSAPDRLTCCSAGRVTAGRRALVGPDDMKAIFG